FYFAGQVAEEDKRAMSRGAYLVEVLGHCSECHTPRNFLGGPDDARAFGGARLGEAAAPNITPHADGIGSWSRDELVTFLKDGTTPDFDVAGGEMAEVIAHGTSKLTDEDRAAMADYLRALAPQAGKP
ncbi:MAG TPA: cytochrome c, partial [Micropepsaceae bacterium]|nr:cytochrome c [Micropepsaceae bacterium]